MTKKKSKITLIAEIEIESTNKAEIKQLFNDILESEKGVKLIKFKAIYK